MSTPSKEKVLVEIAGPVARITLANPPHNVLDVPIMTRLTAAFRDCANAVGVKRPRAILLNSGVAGVYSQGVDPVAVLKTDVEGRKQIFRALGDLVEAMWFCHIPIVCDISGPALAGGAVLASVGDFAVIDANAGKIAFSEVKVGLPVPYFIQRLVMAKVSPRTLNEIILLGRNVDAEEAHRIGFANAVYRSEGERQETVEAMLGRVTRLSPDAITRTLKEKRAPDRPYLAQFRADLTGFADFLTDEFLGKGLSAVIKGESPKF